MAGVDHEGQIMRKGRLNVRTECLLLGFLIEVLVIKIKSGFAKTHDAGMGSVGVEFSLQGRGGCGHIGRMQANGGVNGRMGFGDVEDGAPS